MALWGFDVKFILFNFTGFKIFHPYPGNLPKDT